MRGVECGPSSSPRRESLEARILAVADRIPSHVALEGSGGSMTYFDLACRSVRIAASLRAEGVAPGERVVIRGDYSCLHLAGVVGTMLARCTWVPVHPEDPRARSSAIRKLAKASLELDEEGIRARCQPGGATSAGQDLLRPGVPLLEELSHRDVVALFPTSGTTGEPRLVQISRAGIANLCLAMESRFGLARRDRFLVTASHTFSAYLEEALAPLGCGSTVLLGHAPVDALDAKALFSALSRRKATITELITPVWESVGHQARALGLTVPPGLRLIIVGGERASDVGMAAWSGQPVDIVGVYGATETTATASYFGPVSAADLGKWAGQGLPLGTPVPGTTLSVLRSDGSPARPGEGGELVVSGAAVAAGYSNGPQGSGSAFAKRTADDGTPSWSYSTGDLVSPGPTGELFFIGREDRQVKISGHRVELGDVERTVEALGEVLRAAAVTVAQAGASAEVACHIVLEHASRDRRVEFRVRRALRERFPPAIASARLRFHDELPVTSTGKLDYQKLRTLSERALPQDPGQHDPVGQQDLTLVSLLDFLAEHDALVPDSRRPDRIALSPEITSLGLVRLAGRLSERFGVACDSRTLTASDTFSALVARLAGDAAARHHRLEADVLEAPGPGRSTAVPLTPQQESILVAAELHPGDDVMVEMAAWWLDPAVDASRAVAAFRRVVEAHPALRTQVTLSEDGYAQAGVAEIAAPWVVDVPPDVIPATPRGLRRIVDACSPADFLAPMAGTDEPPVRALLLRTKGRLGIVLKTHHLQFDGRSLEVFVSDLDRASRGDDCDGAGRPSSLDYARWLIAQLSSARGRRDSARLAELVRRSRSEAATAMSTRSDRPGGDRAPEAIYVYERIEGGGPDALRALCRECDVSGANLMMVLWANVLSKNLGSESVVLDVTMANRSDPRFLDTIGLFVNTLPVLVGADEHTRIEAAAANVQRATRALEDVAWVPLEHAVGPGEAHRHRGRCLFSYEGVGLTTPGAPLRSLRRSPSLEVTDLPRSHTAGGLALSVRDRGGVFDMQLESPAGTQDGAALTRLMEELERSFRRLHTASRHTRLAELC